MRKSRLVTARVLQEIRMACSFPTQRQIKVNYINHDSVSLQCNMPCNMQQSQM